MTFNARLAAALDRALGPRQRPCQMMHAQPTVRLAQSKQLCSVTSIGSLLCLFITLSHASAAQSLMRHYFFRTLCSRDGTAGTGTGKLAEPVPVPGTGTCCRYPKTLGTANAIRIASSKTQVSGAACNNEIAANQMLTISALRLDHVQVQLAADWRLAAHGMPS